MSGIEVLVALAIAVGIVGIIVPILPGTLLVVAGLIGWGIHIGEATGWAVVGAALLVLAAGTVVKYAVPGKHLKASGVPSTSLLAGAVLGIIGFFVIPVVGIVIGFVLGIYLAEVARLGEREARRTTWTAVRAVGLSIVIEFAAAVFAATIWAFGLFVT